MCLCEHLMRVFVNVCVCIFVYVIVHVCGSVRGSVNELDETDAHISVGR